MKHTLWNHGWTLNRQKVTLSHDAMLAEDRRADNPSGTAGAFYAGGVYTYEKRFSMEAHDVCMLEFEGIYRETEVWLNGELLCQNHLGSVGFYVDLSGKARADENILTVTVRNDRLPNARWYTGSGIYRPVVMWTSGKTHVAHTGIRVRTPECAEDVSEIVVESPIVHMNDEIAYVRLTTEIIDAHGEIACVESAPVTLFPQENPTITQRLYLRKAKLWSLQSPNLYTARVTITDEKPIRSMEAYMAKKAGTADIHMLDTAETCFGIRHLQVDPVHGFRLNGESILLRGACIHADLGVLGAAVESDAEMRRVQLLKAAGFNSVRIAHQPASKALLDACDREGMLLMEETFDVWNQKKTEFDDAHSFENDWKTVVEYTVQKDFNHPCVIFYSIGNEISNLHTDDGARYSRLLSDAFRSLDSTRLVTNAVNGGMAAEKDQIAMLFDMQLLRRDEIARVTGKQDGTAQDFIEAIHEAMKTGNINDLMTLLSGKMEQLTAHPLIAGRLEEAFSHLDICGYNYMLAAYACDTTSYPNRIIFGSETTPPEIAKLWKWCKADPANLGDFTWTGWDYLGETGVGITNYESEMTFSAPYPAHLAYCGDIDLTGYRRPLSYLREIVFGLRNTPYLSVQLPQHYGANAKNTPWAVVETVHSWTWREFEGKPVHVEVYSPGDEVILRLNGKQIGRSRLEDCRAGFETEYIPGKLEAVAFSGGREMGRDMLSTSGEETGLHVRMWQGDHLSFLEVQIVDDKDRSVMDSERVITVITDACELIGMGSGDPLCTETFLGNAHTTYRGRLLVVLRGHGNVTLKAEGLKVKTFDV